MGRGYLPLYIVTSSGGGGGIRWTSINDSRGGAAIYSQGIIPNLTRAPTLIMFNERYFLGLRFTRLMHIPCETSYAFTVFRLLWGTYCHSTRHNANGYT